MQEARWEAPDYRQEFAHGGGQSVPTTPTSHGKITLPLPEPKTEWK
jgi:hypothetical protein